MVLVPFAYFTALTIYWWIKHRGMDICVYMSALYAFTSLCAVCIVFGDMLEAEGGIHFDDYNLELGITPTVLYCALLTAGMYPFSLIYNKEIKHVEQPSSLILESLCWLLFIIFLINFYLIADSTIEILSGDLSNVRSDHYEGIESPAELKAQSLPSIFGYILYFRQTTILGLPLFFYYNCFSNKAWWFKTMLLATSITLPLYGLQMADRTEFTFYGMMFIFCLIFFWKYLTRKFKHRLIAIGAPFIFAILIYLIAVSQARFAKGNDNEKAYKAALQYAGQNYLNFCYFWEYAKFEYISPERELPFTYHTLFKIDSSPERRETRSGQQGFFISVFATYIGDIMLDLSPIGAILWATFYLLLCLCIIRYAHREIYDVGDVCVIFVLAAIPIFGIFYYRYYSYISFYLFLSAATIYLFSKIHIIYK